MGESMDELDKQNSGQHGTRMAPWCFLQLFVNCTCYTVFFAFSRFRKPARSYSCTLPCSGSCYDCQISSEMLSAGQLGRNLVTLRCWLFANKRFLLWKTWPWSRSQNHRNPSQVFTRPEAFNRRRFLCSIRDIRQRTSPRQICCHHRGHSLSPQASLMDVKQSDSLWQTKPQATITEKCRDGRLLLRFSTS